METIREKVFNEMRTLNIKIAGKQLAIKYITSDIKRLKENVELLDKLLEKE